MLITFNFPTERFEIFTICRRPPVLQTDARVGMMKIVVRETMAFFKTFISSINFILS